METIIPEEILKDRIREVDNHNNIRRCNCDCDNIVDVPFHPYSWDPENNEVIYVGICPKCNKLIYIRD